MKTILKKLKSIKLLLTGHPDFEKGSEFEDRVNDIDYIFEKLSDIENLKENHEHECLLNRFLHRHPGMEIKASLDSKHCIVDISDVNYARVCYGKLKEIRNELLEAIESKDLILAQMEVNRIDNIIYKLK